MVFALISHSKAKTAGVALLILLCIAGMFDGSLAGAEANWTAR